MSGPSLPGRILIRVPSMPWAVNKRSRTSKISRLSRSGFGLLGTWFSESIPGSSSTRQSKIDPSRGIMPSVEWVARLCINGDVPVPVLAISPGRSRSTGIAFAPVIVDFLWRPKPSATPSSALNKYNNAPGRLHPPAASSVAISPSNPASSAPPPGLTTRRLTNPSINTSCASSRTEGGGHIPLPNNLLAVSNAFSTSPSSTHRLTKLSNQISISISPISFLLFSPPWNLKLDAQILGCTPPDPRNPKPHQRKELVSNVPNGYRHSKGSRLKWMGSGGGADPRGGSFHSVICFLHEVRATPLRWPSFASDPDLFEIDDEVLEPGFCGPPSS
mmetsp:Transcript_6591/g.13319  ORF Transcript_6591/g.13319 Transcript_6591/m.13319 type:complete len:331 (-) Transcript_6591:881-1873(-)